MGPGGSGWASGYAREQTAALRWQLYPSESPLPVGQGGGSLLSRTVLREEQSCEPLTAASPPLPPPLPPPPGAAGQRGGSRVSSVF